jgi:hypothetical protein
MYLRIHMVQNPIMILHVLLQEVLGVTAVQVQMMKERQYIKR